MTSVFGGCSSETGEPTPLPFVRHRNLPIRLPRINVNKESWSHQSFSNNTLNKCGRHKSLSCSMMHGRTTTMLPAQKDAMTPVFVNGGPAGRHSVRSTRLSGEAMRLTQPPTPLPITPPAPTSNLSLRDDADHAAGDQDGGGGVGRLRGAVSCAALLLQCSDSGEKIDRSMPSTPSRRLGEASSHPRDHIQVCVNNNQVPAIRSGWPAVQQADLTTSTSGMAGNGSNPFRRQFLSMRSYQSHQKRPLLVTRSNSVRARPSASVPILTELDGQQFLLNTFKAKHYLEMARIKKQSVEQNLSSAYYAVNLLPSSPAIGPASLASLASTDSDTAHRQQQLEQQQQQPTTTTTTSSSSRSALRKSWTSISQESLGDGEEEEEEDGGYTTTLTVGDNGSLHSRFSDSSYLTMLTANTSLSSGYHGPASLMGDPHPASSSSPSCSDDEEVEDDGEDDAIHQQYHNHQQMMMSHCDGTTSGIFYLEWLRQVTGSVPAYVELKQGRLHLKLIQGQSRNNLTTTPPAANWRAIRYNKFLPRLYIIPREFFLLSAH
ncbi:hypothetical protein DAPPUDRAFT_223926 [Daphnia pulex]|uniref:Uncharacterized protein n=1 Tax=Daphnia pulex TaxID=6669 RepID=E9GEN7_DAPPU|nr:hypothetical protein DAPPUDRAFT_223926 [Daphnia pulex]|eukprot:EFX81868.1 hypothetical protein DAPPUDRAFT_223926 [Daphnia pulex]